MINYSFVETIEPSFFSSLKPWLKSVSSNLFPKINDIQYVFSNDDYLWDLNKKQLSHDFLTDIITFDLRENGNAPLDCEIYISLDRVEENAASFNCTFAEELKRVMVHGLLHLTGLNDSTEGEKKIMREAENKLIKSF
jgi:probable rRNA maturation factor